MKKKQIKNWSLMILMAILLPLVTSCSDNKEVYAIEDALQLEWDISNSQSPVGAVECNVFKVKIDKEEGNIVFVSYSLKSVYSSGDKKFVELKGAKLQKVGEGKYKVIDTGY